MKNQVKILSLVAACGLAGIVNAQPYEVTISGATLLENFLKSSASTNDFIDLDGDGVAGSVNADNEQLANQGSSTAAALASDYFVIQYTAVGSGNGIADLDRRGWSRKHTSGFVDGVTNYIRGVDDSADTTPDNPYSGITGNILGDDSFVSSGVADGFMNRVAFISGGSRLGVANANTPRGYPFRTDVAGTHTPSTSTNDATHGVQIDLAPTDVPVAWFITQAGAGMFDNFPNTPGYGNNTVTSLNFDGSSAGESNALKTLVNTNTNTASPHANTIYSTQFTTAVVGYLVNYGTGYSQMDMSDLRHGFATGRLATGENLTFVTRDSGSGTRNAGMNGLCLDPSYGIGENIGLETASSANDLIGPNYQPSNKGGSSRMDGTVRNTRLGVGYTGAERLFNSGYKTANNGTGQMDMLAVRNDIFGTGGATYNRPSIGNVLHNDRDTGYIAQAPSDIASRFFQRLAVFERDESSQFVKVLLEQLAIAEHHRRSARSRRAAPRRKGSVCRAGRLVHRLGATEGRLGDHLPCRRIVHGPSRVEACIEPAPTNEVLQCHEIVRMRGNVHDECNHLGTTQGNPKRERGIGTENHPRPPSKETRSVSEGSNCRTTSALGTRRQRQIAVRNEHRIPFQPNHLQPHHIPAGLPEPPSRGKIKSPGTVNHTLGPPSQATL